MAIFQVIIFQSRFALQRFVANEFVNEHRKTKKKVEHFPSLILNENLFELKLIDLPVIPFFPQDSLTEWTDYRFYGLRSASAYLLVYDVSSPASFHFVKAIREQMYETRDMTNIPVIVVANKMDLVATAANANAATTQFNSFNSHHFLEMTSSVQHHMHLNGAHHHHHAGGGSGGNSNSIPNDSHVSDRKEISHLVRKSWRSAHVECSAKYNWNIVNVFRELAITLDMVANGQALGSGNSSVRKKRCLVF